MQVLSNALQLVSKEGEEVQPHLLQREVYCRQAMFKSRIATGAVIPAGNLCAFNGAFSDHCAKFRLV